MSTPNCNLDIIDDFIKFGDIPVRTKKLINYYLPRYSKKIKDATKGKRVNPTIYQSTNLIKFDLLPMIFSNTLYRVHEKSTQECHEYQVLRYLSILLYGNFYNKSNNPIQSAFLVCDIIVEYFTPSASSQRFRSKINYQSPLDKIDYYIEFIFRPELRQHQHQIMKYFILGLINDPKYDELHKSNDILTELPETIDIGTMSINRHRFITNDNRTVRIHYDNLVSSKYGLYQDLIVEIPKTKLPQMDSRKLEIVNFGFRRMIGTHDKSFQSTSIRNSLDQLYVMLDQQPGLIRTVDQDEIEESSIKFKNSSLLLKYDENDIMSPLYIYQLISTYLPQRIDREQLTLPTLTSDHHQVRLYGDTAYVKISKYFQDDLIEYDPTDASTYNQINIQNLHPARYEMLINNLREIQQRLPRLFKEPEYIPNYFSIQLQHDFFADLFYFFHDHLGGGLNFIYSNKLFKQDRSVLFNLIKPKSKGTGTLQIILNKSFVSDVADSLMMYKAKKITDKIIEYAITETIVIFQILRDDKNDTVVREFPGIEPLANRAIQILQDIH